MTMLTFAKINGTGTIAAGSAPVALSGTSDDIGGMVTITLDPLDDPGVTTPQTLSATVAADGTWSAVFDPSTVPEAQYSFTASVNGVTASQGAYVGTPVAQYLEDNSGILQTKLAAGGRYLVEVSGGQAYRLDLQTGQVVLASSTTDGTAANAAISDVAISADGRYVAFDTTATNLGTGLNGEEEVWRKDLTTGQLTLISADATGTPGNNTFAETNGLFNLSQSYSSLIGMTPDGSHVFYNTNQANLVGAGAPNDGTVLTSPFVITAVMRATVANGAIVDGLPTAATVSNNGVFNQSYDLGIVSNGTDVRGYAIVTGFSDDGSKVLGRVLK
jgi:hypothetical protein